MHQTKFLALAAALTITSSNAITMAAAESLAPAVNQLGLDLLRTLPDGHAKQNVVLSPYSIETALGLAFVGADGATRDEMRRVLHLPENDSDVQGGFTALDQQLDALVAHSRDAAEQMKKYSGAQEPIEFNVANRVYVQRGYPIHRGYLSTVRDVFHSDAPEMDFRGAGEAARTGINRWVEAQTHEKIRDLIPRGGITPETRAVLVNALYLRAPWQKPFYKTSTKPAPFWVGGADSHDVPTMVQTTNCGYAEYPDHLALSLPYVGNELHFLVLLPRERDGLPALLRSLTAEQLATAARLPVREVVLHLPKFKVSGGTLPLASALSRLGMTTAFDRPAGSANFARLAPRRPDDYLYISEVFHQTFLELDERGTEAAAATAVAMAAAAAFVQKPKPVEVHVDRPFGLAIQHAPSGACLFLGWVNDPR